MAKKKSFDAEKSQNPKYAKQIVSLKPDSNNNLFPIWRFDMIDRDGPFAFQYQSESFNHVEVLTKLIEYGNMTWGQIKKQTHDSSGKSKHHNLDVTKLKGDALKRLKVKVEEEDYDSLFSFALQNKLRIIGIVKKDEFHIIWYDPEHKFFPPKK